MCIQVTISHLTVDNFPALILGLMLAELKLSRYSAPPATVAITIHKLSNFKAGASADHSRPSVTWRIQKSQTTPKDPTAEIESDREHAERLSMPGHPFIFSRGRNSQSLSLCFFFFRTVRDSGCSNQLTHTSTNSVIGQVKERPSTQDQKVYPHRSVSPLSISLSKNIFDGSNFKYSSIEKFSKSFFKIWTINWWDEWWDWALLGQSVEKNGGDSTVVA